MNTLTLREYQKSEPVRLSMSQLGALQARIPDLVIQPAYGSPDHYCLTPGAHVGMLRVGSLQVDIRPKVTVENLLFLLTYALDPGIWEPEEVHYQHVETVTDAVADLFQRLVARAVRRGLLHSYRTEEESLFTVRGRVRFSDQLRKHHGRLLPVEVTYDEYSVDILENQLLLAALIQLQRLPLRNLYVRRGLQIVQASFENVSEIRFSPQRLPELPIHGLNGHYATAIALARLILQSAGLDQGEHSASASGLLINMNEVFERFVHGALGEALQLKEKAFPANANGRYLYLDQERCVRLKPDLSWWEGSRCRFVGDVKYKKNETGFKHGDLYQLLAYTTATGLPSGMLIYAEGEVDPHSYHVSLAHKELIVRKLDLARKPQEILRDVGEIAQAIRAEKAEEAISAR
jgi:5-methylcytosine-specific restriction enzyme subunit McrC